MEDGLETVTTGEARQQLADLINRAAFGGERVILTRRGKRVAALISIEDLELIEALDFDDDPSDEPNAEGRTYLRAEDDPVLAAIWDNDEDAVYDNL